MNSSPTASASLAPAQPDSPRIVGICGSLNHLSATRRALVLSLEAAARAGAATQLLDLRDFRLPFASSGFDASEFPDVERFNRLVRECDGHIWATPEYHGSFSGALKNALDLGSFGEYEGKVVALLGVAGGQIGAINALSHLRTVARQLHAWVLPQQVSIARVSGAFDENGGLRDEKLAQSVESLGRDLAKWAKLHRAEAAQNRSRAS